MVRHTKITKDTKIEPGDEVLAMGHWVKVAKDQKNQKEYLFIGSQGGFIKRDRLNNINWEISTRTDLSDAYPEYEVAVIKVEDEEATQMFTTPGELKLILFNEESNIVPTKRNLEYMRAIAEQVKNYLNKEQIVFEKEE